jgi:hypothetical protein
MHAPAREGALPAAARADLEGALRSFGHPVVAGPVRPWQRLDRRFRRAASLEWFTGGSSQPGIRIERGARSTATIRTQGAISLEVPWLPCAAPERIAACRIRPSADPSCTTVALAGAPPSPRDGDGGDGMLRVTPEMLLGQGQTVEVACVVQCGLTDEAAFGNVLLGQAGVPTIALDCEDLRALFPEDVAIYGERAELRDAAARVVADAGLRARYGRVIAADSRRRFSPRRSAVRVVDLLCAARFGLERSVPARSDTPL